MYVSIFLLDNVYLYLFLFREVIAPVHQIEGSKHDREQNPATDNVNG